VALVGDIERDAAVDALRSAYVDGYLSDRDLSERLGEALSARSSGELGASVRGLPGGAWLMLSLALRPFVSARTRPVRRRAGGLLRRLALWLFVLSSAFVLLGFGIWTLADGLSAQGALAFLVLWVALSAPSWLLWRSARRLLR
jgi:hypothetical protein